MNIAGSFLIHFQMQSYHKQIKYSYSRWQSYFFDHDIVIIAVIDLYIVGTKVDTKCIVCHCRYPFLYQKFLLSEASIPVIANNNVV